MTFMRLRIDYWTVSHAIPPFDKDVDFNSSGIWIKIDCKAEVWKMIHLLMGWKCTAPAHINGRLGHFIIDKTSTCPDDGNICLLVRLKFYPYKQS